MKERFNNIKKIYHTHRNIFDKRMIVFAIFFLFSAFFWLLTAFDKDYNSSISYPIIYDNIPEKLIIANNLPSELDIKVNARGFTLLRNFLGLDNVAIRLDFKNMATLIQKKESNVTYQILLNNYFHEISRQINSDFNLINVKPSIIELQFSEQASKTVPVKPRINYIFAHQHQIRGKMKILPDSVIISGPEDMINDISYVNTKEVKFEGIKERIEKQLQLETIEQVSISPNNIAVIIDVEKFTEQSIKIPIEVINVPQKQNVILVNTELEIKYIVGLSRFDIISKDSFEAVIDFKEQTKNGMPDNFQVNLTKYPSFVKILNYSPHSTYYYIKYKK